MIKEMKELLVLQQNYRLYDSYVDNIHYKEKYINNITVMNGFIVLFNILFNNDQLNILLFSSISVYIVLMLVAAYSLRPINKKIAGGWDWEEIFTNYIYSEECFEQLLSNILCAVESVNKLNSYRLKWTYVIQSLTMLQFFLIVLIYINVFWS